MSIFDRFKGKSTHAQPVETNNGSWKASLAKDDRNEFRYITAAKAAAIVMCGAAVLTVGAPAFAVMTAVMGLGMYALSANGQAAIRRNAEKNDNTPPQPQQKRKHLARYLLQPF